MAKYYYNGVLLPEIPDELASYPYSYLQKNKSSGDLRFVCAKSAVYYSSTYNNLVIPEGGRCSCKLSADGTEWVVVGTYEDSVNIFLSSCELLWSNHNIRNGSATATKIYFYSTYPIPEADECYYNGVRLPAIPVDAIWEAPYYWIATHQDGSIKCRCFGEPSYLNSKGELVPKASSVYYQFSYKVSENRWHVDAKQDSANWGQLLSADGWSLSWSNHDIRNGSATSTTIYFYGNSPVAVEPETPSGRTSGYLIRSNSTLYTVTDGELSALTETEVTASLFQTYGVDDLPDGSLLVGQTDPEVLYWQDSTDELPTLSLTVKGTPPLPQMFTSEPMDLTHESIAGISHAAVDASEDVRFAISFDGGTTWKAHDGSAWFDTSDTVPGMLASTMNAITAEQWAEVVVLESYMVRFWLPNVTAYVKSVVMHYINP